MKKLWKVLKCAVTDFFADDSFTLAAALAFYTILSLSPIAVLLVVAAGVIGQSTIDSIVGQAENIMGSAAGDAIKTVIESARKERQALTLSAALSLGVVLLTALGAFVQLQYSINRIWGIQAGGKSAVWNWVRKRLLSLLLLMVIAMLLIISLILTSVLGNAFPELTLISTLASFLVFVLLFAVMFKYLPDAKLPWADVWIGAVLTALLFSVGVWLIGLYLGQSGAGSAYGAAGSLVVFLLWVYYATLILFFGAEITQAYSFVYGEKIEPAEYVKRIDKHEAQDHQQKCQ